MVSQKVDEACRKETTPQLDLISTVKEFHVLSSKELGRLIRDAENGIIKYTINGSSCEINVENLTRQLVKYISKDLLSSLTPDEQHFKNLLSGLRLLHTLCDIACYDSTLARVLVEDMDVQTEILSSIIHIIIFLSQLGEEINGSDQMVLLYAALLSSSMYLLRALISSKWRDITDVLLAHPMVHKFTIAAFSAVGVVISSLPTKRIVVNEVYCLYHNCESCLQFLQALFKQMLFREHIVENEELCGRGAVFQLVQSTLKLSQYEGSHVMDVVYRLKSKVLAIMLLLCEAKSSSFVDIASSTTQSRELAESAISEVLEVLKKMFCGALKDHPRGLLQLNAMQLTEIFSRASSFRTFLVSNLTEVLTRVFSQPQREFVSIWCSDDCEPAEEDTIMDFDPISATAQVMGLTSTLQVKHSTWNNFQPPQTPYAIQGSRLLVKILTNLTCYEDENAFFVNEFRECLQTAISRLPGGAMERTAAACRNLSSLLAHAKSLTPIYLDKEDVDVLRWFISQLEKPPAVQESDSRRVMEVHNSTQCPSPTPQSPSPNEHDTNGNHDEGVSVNLALMIFKENGQSLSNEVAGEDQMTGLGVTTGDQNIEPINSMKNVEFRSEQSEEKQQNKRKRSIMNDKQIDMIEKALLDQPVLQRRDGSLQLWAAKLSLHGSEVTPSQLRNWLSNRKAKLARKAAKEASVHSDGDEVLPENQTGSGPDPNSPESLMDTDYDPSASISQMTHQNDLRWSVSRNRGSQPKRTQETEAGPTNRFKREVGQHVMLKDDQGEEIGKGSIYLTRGVWLGRDLEKLGLCVVDVEELNWWEWGHLPHPTDGITTFSDAELALGKKRIMWDSNKLFLIQS